MQNKSNHILTRVMVCFSPVVLIALQVWNPDPTEVGLCDRNTFGLLSYHFFHASWIHLALNWWCMTGLLIRREYSWKEIALCYIIASLYPFYSEQPTIGLSGIIYAMAGLFSCNILTIVIMLSTIAATLYMPHMAAGLHLWCYVIALVIRFNYDKERERHI